MSASGARRGFELLRRRIRQTAGLPLDQVLRRALRRAQRIVRTRMRRRLDLRTGTYLTGEPPERLEVRIAPSDLPPPNRAIAEAVGELIVSHRFDLLGSGWTHVSYGAKCRGVEAHVFPAGTSVVPDPEGLWLESRVCSTNLARAKEVWGLVDAGYQPIDWQLDFKSGYRWSESAWCGDLIFGNLLGADVKVPWELSRFQHASWLAQAFAATGRAEFAREFQNQVLDWIATNPPRFGINWSCTMDVGIRIANWFVARDLFLAWGAHFDDGFEEVLARSAREHGRHIVGALEWDPVVRGNHYLADIVGLLFVAAYLPRSSECDAWLAFGVRELIAETSLQFGDDGGCFESSTSYHRLSSEMVVYATALVQGLPARRRAALADHPPARFAGPAPLLSPSAGEITPFPTEHFGRIERMAEFTAALTAPDGLVPQVGDNDSGRFLRLELAFVPRTVRQVRECYLQLADYSGMDRTETFWDSVHGDHRHLLSAISALIDRPDFLKRAGGSGMDAAVVRSLAGGEPMPSQSRAPLRGVGERADIAAIEERIAALPESAVHTYRFPAHPVGDLREGLESFAFPEFGLHVLRSSRLHIAFRCGGVWLDRFSGHAHDDQLSVEMFIDGARPVRDPGTYIYTPLPHRRNEYRSAAAHWSPATEVAPPARLDLGMFDARIRARGRWIGTSSGEMAGEVSGPGGRVCRVIRVTESAVEITDALFSGSGGIVGPARVELPYSPGYGVLEDVACLSIP